MGTRGLGRKQVNGFKRVPKPPAMITDFNDFTSLNLGADSSLQPVLSVLLVYKQVL